MAQKGCPFHSTFHRFAGLTISAAGLICRDGHVGYARAGRNELELS